MSDRFEDETNYADDYYKVAEAESLNADKFNCDSCGAPMVFDPLTQNLKCSHCGHTVECAKNYQVKEYDIEAAFAKAEQWNKNDNIAFRCDNCGATIILNSDEVASSCPFCGTSHIVKSEKLDGLKPQAVIPFVIDSSNADTIVKKYVRDKWFVPGVFKKNISLSTSKGIYQPIFTFDSNTFSTYKGRVGDRHTRTVGSGKNRRTETYIVYRNVSGTYAFFFDDMFITANETLNQGKLNSLQPFRRDLTCVYDKKYLSGFIANHYNKDLKVCWKEAKTKMDVEIRRAIINKCHCDTVDYMNISTNHKDVTYKYVLLPVYVMTYNYKGKPYSLLVNGTTGKSTGKLPTSFWRVFFFALFWVIVAGALFYLFSTNSESYDNDSDLMVTILNMVNNFLN